MISLPKVSSSTPYFLREYLFNKIFISWGFFLELLIRLISGSDAIVEVISGACERICEDLEAKELSLIFDCLYKEIRESIAENSMVRANRLLTVLVSSVGVDYGRKISGDNFLKIILLKEFLFLYQPLQSNFADYGPLLELTNLLVKMLPLSHGSEDWMSSILDNVLSLMIKILEGLSSCSNLSAVISCSIKWAPVFQLQHLRFDPLCDHTFKNQYSFYF